MAANNVRTFMLDRFRQLLKKNQVIGVEQNAEATTWDVKFNNNCVLRMNNDEYAAVQSQIKIQSPPPGGGGT